MALALLNLPGRDSEREQEEGWDVCRLLVAQVGAGMGPIELYSPCLKEKEPRFGLVERQAWSREGRKDRFGLSPRLEQLKDEA